MLSLINNLKRKKELKEFIQFYIHPFSLKEKIISVIEDSIKHMIKDSSKYTNLVILQAWFDFKMPTRTLQLQAQIAALII